MQLDSVVTKFNVFSLSDEASFGVTLNMEEAITFIHWSEASNLYVTG